MSFNKTYTDYIELSYSQIECHLENWLPIQNERHGQLIKFGVSPTSNKQRKGCKSGADENRCWQVLSGYTYTITVTVNLLSKQRHLGYVQISGETNTMKRLNINNDTTGTVLLRWAVALTYDQLVLSRLWGAPTPRHFQTRGVRSKGWNPDRIHFCFIPESSTADLMRALNNPRAGDELCLNAAKDKEDISRATVYWPLTAKWFVIWHHRRPAASIKYQPWWNVSRSGNDYDIPAGHCLKLCTGRNIFNDYCANGDDSGWNWVNYWYLGNL